MSDRKPVITQKDEEQRRLAQRADRQKLTGSDSYRAADARKGFLKILGEARAAAAKRKNKLFCMRLPQSFFERLKAAKRPGQSVGAFIIEGMSEYLATHEGTVGRLKDPKSST
jgi:hypothetical protein